MSTKKSIINKDRFKSLSNISAFETSISYEKEKPESESLKSRFEFDTNLSSAGKIYLDKLVSAPDEWNFYSPLSDDKFLELIDSIEKNSLLHPIVVWEKDDRYMILSGHNRVRAYKQLLEMTGEDRYRQIPAIIKKKEEINENIAKEIIVDTNWIQRQLSTYEKTQSILQKYVRIKSEKLKGERTRDLIAGHLGISGRMVQNYLSLNKLKSEFFELIDSGVINIKIAVLLSKLPMTLQDKILANKDEINFDINTIKKAINQRKESDILQMMMKKEPDPSDIITVKLQIRRDQEDDFMKMYKKWLLGK